MSTSPVEQAARWLRENGHIVTLRTTPDSVTKYQVRRSSGMDVNFHSWLTEAQFLAEAKTAGWSGVQTEEGA